jgi:hypothetical protein
VTLRSPETPDWFEHLTGFQERDYRDTQAKLEVTGTALRSKVNGAAYGIGSLELASLHMLRDRVAAGPALRGRLQVSIVQGDVRAMHRREENAGALFQVAPQFNLLEAQRDSKRASGRQVSVMGR